MSRTKDPRRTRAESARPARSRSRRNGGGTLIGVFIGLVIGLAMAAGVAYYILKAGNPYQPAVKEAARETPRDGAREPAKTAKSDPAAPDKPRFDFYKILPGTEEPKVQQKGAERPPIDKATVERAAVPEKSAKAEAPVPPAARAGERFWLQAGSFASAGDADDLKARLAFAGWEAAVQQATLPDKAIRYRVRLGPFDNTDELNRVKSDLAKRGFDVAVIKF